MSGPFIPGAVRRAMVTVSGAWARSLADVVRTWIMPDLGLRSAYGEARRERYREVSALEQFPANSGIG